jgi:hypothetical protein
LPGARRETLGDRGYVLREAGLNVLAMHSEDKTSAELNSAKQMK